MSLLAKTLPSPPLSTRSPRFHSLWSSGARGNPFQLITVDGDVLGARQLSGPDWPPGSVIYTGPEAPNLHNPHHWWSRCSRSRNSQRRASRSSSTSH